MASNGEHQVEDDDLRNEFEAWAALAHSEAYATFLRNCRDTDSYASWCVEFSDEENLALLFGTKLRSAWPKDNIAAEVAKCLKVSVCADTVCGVYTVDMFEGHGAVVVGGGDFYASLSTLPDGAVIGAALGKDLFEKIAEEYGIAR